MELKLGQLGQMVKIGRSRSKWLKLGQFCQNVKIRSSQSNGQFGS